MSVQLVKDETIKMITRATTLDVKGFHKSALPLYKEGLKKLEEEIENIDREELRAKYYPRVEQYRERIKEIEVLLNEASSNLEEGVLEESSNLEEVVPKESSNQEEVVPKESPNLGHKVAGAGGNQHLQQKIVEERRPSFKEIRIKENETGHGFESMLGGCFDETVTSIYIAEPWLLNSYQFDNFFRFTELVVKKSPNLKSFTLKTNAQSEKLEPIVDQTETKSKKQKGWVNKKQKELRRLHETRKLKSKLKELKQSLFQRNIAFSWEFDTELHDRRIDVTCKDNGQWLILMGRGLDIYHKPEGKMNPGFYDLDLRKCRKTDVEIIFKCKN